jgi:hypothetical protein
MNDGKIESFLLSTGLYDKQGISKDDIDELESFLTDEYKIDSYCLQCEKERTFTANRVTSKSKTVGGPIIMATFYQFDEDESSPEEENTDNIVNQLEQQRYEELIRKHGHVVRWFSCSRDQNHKLIFDLILDNNAIMKIGQFPSIADIERSGLKKYRKILKDQFKEFSRAVGLCSHGIGIGSFVYLRRIFERLIEEAYLIAKEESGWDEQKYQGQRMNEKILTLKEQLPSFLVEQRKIYGILSKGIHELSEEECLSAFPAIRVGIELILDEKIEKEEREKKIREVSKALNRIEKETQN